MSFNLSSLDRNEWAWRRPKTYFRPKVGIHESFNELVQDDVPQGFKKSIPIPSVPPSSFQQPVAPWVDARKANPSPKINWAEFPKTIKGGESRHE